ncbi:MAG: hypothetical protein ACR2I0_15325 [Rhodoferax sp.]
MNQAHIAPPPRVGRIALVPYLVLPCIALAVLAMLVGLVRRAVHDKGLMPPPAAARSYACQDFATPFTLLYRHGAEVLQLQAAAQRFAGTLSAGAIVWADVAAVQAALGGAAPTQIDFIDPKGLQVRDPAGAAHGCVLLQ